MSTIHKGFSQKEEYTETELRRHFGSAEKCNLSCKGILYFIFGSVCVLVISPVIPRKIQSNGRALPNNLEDYLLDVKNFLLLYILIFFLISLRLLVVSGRRKLDKRLGYKLVVTREITGIIRLPKRKLLILDSCIPFILNERGLGFQNVTSGQLIQTVRTGTLKLLRYRIQGD